VSFIVVFDDEQSICSPMGWDADCEGALTGYTGAVAVFESRADARRAIAVSRAYMRLCEAQGKPTNSDWRTGCAHCIKVLPLQPETLT
jgi:hypothetical protein